MAADLLDTVAERADFSGLSAPVLVGCSGGADSLALLVLSARAGLRPVAVYVDHQLRADSAADAQVVRDAAHRVGGRWHTVPVTLAAGPHPAAPARAPRPPAPVTLAAGATLEARARAARYQALDKERVEVGAEWLLVGHTADDQAETVLLNVLRGAAAAGIAGMAARRRPVARPLLGLRRST